MADLTLGAKKDNLRVIYTPDDPFTAVLELEDTEGAPAPWPAAPRLEFPDLAAEDWVATLSGDSLVATFTLSEGEINAFHALAKTEATAVRLSVSGLTWWKGYTEPDA